MRVLLVHPGPAFSVADVFDGWRTGLTAAGAQVVPFNLGDRLDFFAAADVNGHRLDQQAITAHAAEGILAAAMRVRPDVVLVVSGFFVTANVLDCLRAHGIKVVLLHTESPYQDDEQLTRAAHADLNLINDPTNWDAFSDVAPTYYQPHCYRPELHRPRPALDELRSDVVFVGTGYPSRIALLEDVDWSGIDLALAGNWGDLHADSPLREHLVHEPDECSHAELTADLYASAGMSLNAYRREANRPEWSTGWAMGPREVELAAMGVFFARDPRPEGDDVLAMLPTFTSPDELADIVRWSMQHPDDREAAARAARQAIAGRTFDRSARHLLTVLNGVT